MKWILAVVFVVCGGYFGKRAGDRYVGRYRIMSGLVLFCDYYVAQMKFHKIKVAEILRGFAGGSEITGLLREAAEISAERASEVTCPLLTDDERARVTAFFGELGRSDAPAQEQTTAGYREFFSAYCAAAEKEKSKYAPMCLKLGFLFGLLCAVILI